MKGTGCWVMGHGKRADSCKEVLKAHLGFPLMDSVDEGVVRLFREALNLSLFSASVQKCQMAHRFGVKPEQRCRHPIARVMHFRLG